MGGDRVSGEDLTGDRGRVGAAQVAGEGGVVVGVGVAEGEVDASVPVAGG